MNNILEFIITAKDEASEKLKSFSNNLEGLKPTFTAAAVAGGAAFAGIASVIDSSINAYAEAERNQRQLEHAIIDVSHGTAEQVKQVNSLTDALQRKSGIDGDALNAGVAQLSTFGLQTDSVIKLTKSLADLTINQNGVKATTDNYISSANIMAKALEGNFGLLTKMGIRFTEAQQEIIKHGTETQKVAAIQEGFAQNLRETTDTVTGYDVTIGKLSQSFGDIKEAIGKDLQPTIDILSAKIVPIIQRIGDWTKNNPQLTATIIIFAGVLAGFVAIVGTLGLLLPTIITGFGLLVSPIGLVILAIGALIAITAVIIANWDKISNYFKQVWEGIKIIFKQAIDGIIDYFSPLIKVIDSIVSKIERIISAAKSVGGGIVSGISNFFSGAKAQGGMVSAGSTYLVGERGQEYFTPSQSGYITPNGGGTGGGNYNFNININGGMVTKEVAAQIGDMIVGNFKSLNRI